jgi:hypothetical protein
VFRTQIYLTEKEKAGLETAAHSCGLSQSEMIRRAIDDMLAATDQMNRLSIIDRTAGIWKDRKETINIRELRAGWKKRIAQ